MGRLVELHVWSEIENYEHQTDLPRPESTSTTLRKFFYRKLLFIMLSYFRYAFLLFYQNSQEVHQLEYNIEK